MAIIVTKTSRLAIPEKLSRGQLFINAGTDNPLVPGNEAALAAFAEVQQELADAEAAIGVIRQTLKEMLSRREDIENRWDQRLSQLAAFTKFATDGNPTAMLSAGFLVRERNAPSHIPAAPKVLKARTNGSPGRTKLTWTPVDGALIYILQMCLSSMPDDNWTDLPISTKSSCEVDGAEPGKVAWFRVAAVNTAGQGPWSAAAQRGVM